MRSLLQAFPETESLRLRSRTVLIAAAWTVVVAISGTLSYGAHNKSVLQEARLQARIDLQKGELVRLWADSFDGVYVRTHGSGMPPLAASHSETSAVDAGAVRRLTRLSPMTIVRQVEAMADGQGGNHIELSSLNPLRAANAPDTWEAAALHALARGQQEVSSVETIGGQQVMRVMRPLLADESCLVCHQEKGLKAGDVRGGAAASVSLEPLWAADRRALASTSIAHFIFWGLGLVVIVYGARRTRQRRLERTRGETAVRESEARLRAVMQSANDGIVTVDDAGNIAGWNHGAGLIFGYVESEVMGRPLSLLIPHRPRQHHDAEVQRLLGGGEGRVAGEAMVLEGRRKDSTTFPLELSLARWETSSGRFVTGIMRDITERMRADAELREAKAAAEAAARAKSEFLANMSHEIRTPMNAVIGMTGLLLDTKLDPEQREFVETVRSGGDSLLTIINDILDFSKIESGYLAIEEEAFDVRDCVESALDLVAGRAAEKRLDLAYLIASTVPATLVGDVTRLRQVLLNLLSNAVKFTGVGRRVRRGGFAAARRWPLRVARECP